jgi:hypothetical protein
MSPDQFEEAGRGIDVILQAIQHGDHEVAEYVVDSRNEK